MKKLVTILIFFVFLSSCKKDDPPPQLTGTWDLYQTFTSDGSTYNWTVVISQDGKNLTGNTVISDNSGYALLLASSNVSGNNVTIDWMLSTYKLSHQGTINSTYKSMNGMFYFDGVKIGTWLANKKP